MNIAEIIEELSNTVSIADIAILLPGIILLITWLMVTSFGTKALVDSAPRRNNMPLYMPFVPFFVAFLITPSAAVILKEMLPNLNKGQEAALLNLVACIGSAAAIIIALLIAKKYFVRGPVGLGLRLKTIAKDFPMAIVNLVTVMPAVLIALGLTILFGKLIYGQDFKIEEHAELELLTKYPELYIRVIIVVTTVVAAPIFEEMVFRGLFQTMIRSVLVKPWRSIFVTSLLFAIVHANPEHWPALFGLSCCIGYSYEKSGSLFRPIFVHALFNATSIVTVLNQ